MRCVTLNMMFYLSKLQVLPMPSEDNIGHSAEDLSKD